MVPGNASTFNLLSISRDEAVLRLPNTAGKSYLVDEDSIRKVQVALNGWIAGEGSTSGLAPISVSGTYDRITAAAVRVFQVRKGMRPD